MAYSLVAGDLAPSMLITLSAPGAQAALATAQSVELRWQRPDGSVTVTPLVVVNASLFQVKKTWTAGDTDQVGEHRGQIIVTDASGNPTTDPNQGDDIVWVVYPIL